MYADYIINVFKIFRGKYRRTVVFFPSGFLFYSYKRASYKVTLFFILQTKYLILEQIFNMLCYRYKSFAMCNNMAYGNT